MVEIKPADGDRFLAKPDPNIRVVLLYGDDDGVIAERAQNFVRAVTGSTDDPFAVVRLEVDTLADDPGRLSDEAHAVPLFGGTRAIFVRLQGNRSIVPALEPVLASPPVDSFIVIAAGDLRKTSPVRRLIETHKRAVAIGCYADSARDLDRIIDEEAGRADLTIAPEARSALKGLIGGDRLASRSEVQKLCLYAAENGEIGLDDVRAIVGDASAFQVDDAVDAAALGDAAALADTYGRLIGSGTPGFVVAGAALRHFTYLHRSRAAVDDGASPESVVADRGAMIFFRRRSVVARQLSLWSRSRIERALEIIDRAIIDSRLKSAIADEVIGQALTMIAAIAGSGRRDR